MRGRKPKPNAILKKNGSRRVRKDEPEFTSKLGKPPEILKGRALEVWTETAAELEALGMGTRVEANALCNYCLAVAQVELCQKDLDENGLVLATARGVVKNPAATIQNQASVRVAKYACEFGLTPASRGRIGGYEASEENEFEKD